MLWKLVNVLVDFYSIYIHSINISKRDTHKNSKFATKSKISKFNKIGRIDCNTWIVVVFDDAPQNSNVAIWWMENVVTIYIYFFSYLRQRRTMMMKNWKTNNFLRHFFKRNPFPEFVVTGWARIEKYQDNAESSTSWNGCTSRALSSSSSYSAWLRILHWLAQ